MTSRTVMNQLQLTFSCTSRALTEYLVPAIVFLGHGHYRRPEYRYARHVFRQDAKHPSSCEHIYLLHVNSVIESLTSGKTRARNQVASPLASSYLLTIFGDEKVSDIRSSVVYALFGSLFNALTPCLQDLTADDSPLAAAILFTITLYTHAQKDMNY